jgi:curved DNA-binding protein CbpA
MKRIQTHYDNLKVSRDAPQEVIRAAYRALSQRFHPDKHPGNGRANQIMARVNRAYAVLSDPEARRAHDDWIAQQEAHGHGDDLATSGSASAPATEDSSNENPGSAVSAWRIIYRIVTYGAFTAFLLGAFYFAMVREERPPPILQSPNDTKWTDKDFTWTGEDIDLSDLEAKDRALSEPRYLRPTAAPNGTAWPKSAGYVSGYPRLNASGMSRVTVDNKRNDSDVFVKLVSLRSKDALPVRQFYIPANASFTVRDLRPGTYDIRYRDLETGALSRSEPFEVEQFDTQTGFRFSDISLTLYKVPNGNSQTYPISESEF